MFNYPQVSRAQNEVHLAREKLDSLIDLYRKQLGIRKLEFMNVSGTTHLIEVVEFEIQMDLFSRYLKVPRKL